MKWPKKADQVDETKYYKFHRLISHPIEKCFILKDKIIELYKEENFEFEEVVTSNMAMTTSSTSLASTPISIIKFESFDHKKVNIVPTSSEDAKQANAGNTCS